MSALNRHPWSRKFKAWLHAGGFELKTRTWTRAGGESQLLLIGDFAARDRASIVFLHGLGNDVLYPNIGLFRHLLTNRYNLITCDLDGHGQNLSSLFSQSTASTLIPDMLEIADSLIHDCSHLHFCGYSFGAVLSLNYAIHNPNRVRSLSLIGMPLKLEASLGLMTEAMTPFLKTYRQALTDYGLAGIHPAIGPFLRQRYPVRTNPNEIGSYLDIAGRIIRALKPAEMICQTTFPTLYIAGSLDYIAGGHATAQFLKELKIAHQVLSGETHFSSMLTPEMSKRIEDFLRNLG